MFRIQGADELAEAERRYLPRGAETVRGIILAAKQGLEMGDATRTVPKCMLPMSGRPLLSHIASAFRSAGLRDLTAVRGFGAEAVTVDGVSYLDMDDAETDDVGALRLALDGTAGPVVIATTDVVFKRHVVEELVDAGGDIVIAVDPSRPADVPPASVTVPVACTGGEPHDAFRHAVTLSAVNPGPESPGRRGEWIGLAYASEEGIAAIRDALARVDRPAEGMGDVLGALVTAGVEVGVVYTTGSWLAIDGIEDLLGGERFS